MGVAFCPRPDFILLLLFISISLSLLSCAGMNAQQIKATMEECNEYELGTLVYQRSEGAVMAVRYIPKAGTVDQTVIMKRRASHQIV